MICARESQFDWHGDTSRTVVIVDGATLDTVGESDGPACKGFVLFGGVPHSVVPRAGSSWVVLEPVSRHELPCGIWEVLHNSYITVGRP